MPVGLQTLTYTATSVAYTAAQKIATESNSDGPPDRTIRLFAHTTSTTTGTAIARVSLCDNVRLGSSAQCYFADVVTITHATTNPRAGIDGASGAYICAVSFASSSLDRADLMGAARAGSTYDLEWRIGLTAAAIDVNTSFPLLLYVATDNEV